MEEKTRTRVTEDIKQKREIEREKDKEGKNIGYFSEV